MLILYLGCFLCINLGYIGLYILVLNIIQKRKKFHQKNTVNKIKENMHYLIIAIMPLIWYIVFRGHTTNGTHFTFIYRCMLVFDFGIILWLLESKKEIECKKDKIDKE